MLLPRLGFSRSIWLGLAIALLGCGTSVSVSSGGTTDDTARGGAGASAGTSTVGGGPSSGSGGCIDDPGLGAAFVDPMCGPNGAGPIAGALSAVAIRDASNGWLEIDVSSDGAATCADNYHFPEGCAPAWRVRLHLSPAQQIEGAQPIGPDAAFAYVDAQKPSGGTYCSNADAGDLSGVLRIDHLDETEVRGSLCGTGAHDGTFTAHLCCTACKGTGMACSSDSECCTKFCGGGTCDP